MTTQACPLPLNNFKDQLRSTNDSRDLDLKSVRQLVQSGPFNPEKHLREYIVLQRGFIDSTGFTISFRCCYLWSASSQIPLKSGLCGAKPEPFNEASL
jgi:hypothetical protein